MARSHTRWPSFALFVPHPPPGSHRGLGDQGISSVYPQAVMGSPLCSRSPSKGRRLPGGLLPPNRAISSCALSHPTKRRLPHCSPPFSPGCRACLDFRELCGPLAETKGKAPPAGGGLAQHTEAGLPGEECGAVRSSSE